MSPINPLTNFIAGLNQTIFCPSKCTIQENTGIVDTETGYTVPGYTNLNGHEELPCRIGPLVIDRPSDEVMREDDKETRYKDLHVFLPAYYPDIKKDQYALIDDYLYTISNVQYDGNHLTTRLRVWAATSVNPD